MADQQESSHSLNLKSIPEMDGYYAAINGDIYSCKRNNIPKIMKQRDHFGNHTNQPYKRLKVNGKHMLAHRVIASLLIGRQLMKTEQVNHIDGNASNNCLDNLEIVTHEENVKHAVDRGLYCNGPAWYAARGMSCPEGRESSETR